MDSRYTLGRIREICRQFPDADKTEPDATATPRKSVKDRCKLELITLIKPGFYEFQIIADGVK
jgi:hypothetical protein